MMIDKPTLALPAAEVVHSTCPVRAILPAISCAGTWTTLTRGVTPRMFPLIPWFTPPRWAWDRRSDLTQSVDLVDNGCDLSGFHEIVHDDQVVFVRSCQKGNKSLAHEP